jgi:hypothetical protein
VSPSLVGDQSRDGAFRIDSPGNAPNSGDGWSDGGPNADPDASIATWNRGDGFGEMVKRFFDNGRANLAAARRRPETGNHPVAVDTPPT